MALKKTIPTIYGIDAEYWKIIHISSDFKGTTTVAIAGFLNKDARFNNVEPLYTFTKLFNLEDITRTIAYTELKQSNIIDGVEQNIFVDALDD